MSKKKEEIKTTHKLVKEILTKYKKARNSDYYLFKKVVEKTCPEAIGKPFGEAWSYIQESGVPCYETVARTRRHIQSKCPELQGDERVVKVREENTEDFENYSRS